MKLNLCATALASIVAGCGAGSTSTPDANPPGDDAAAAIDAAVGVDAAPGLDAAPAPVTNGIAACGKPVVYLNFTGVTLLDGFASEATVNLWDVGNATIVPVGDRARTDAVRDAAFARLAMHRIPATTTRPAAAPYMMIAFHGGSDATLPVTGATSISAFDCGNQNPNDVAVFQLTRIFEQGWSEALIAAAVVRTVGSAHGLGQVSDPAFPRTCMRRDLVADCEFYAAIPTVTCAAANQDQLAVLAANVGCP